MRHHSLLSFLFLILLCAFAVPLSRAQDDTQLFSDILDKVEADVEARTGREFNSLSDLEQTKLLAWYISGQRQHILEAGMAESLYDSLIQSMETYISNRERGEALNSIARRVILGDYDDEVTIVLGLARSAIPDFVSSGEMTEESNFFAGLRPRLPGDTVDGNDADGETDTPALDSPGSEEDVPAPDIDDGHEQEDEEGEEAEQEQTDQPERNVQAEEESDDLPEQTRSDADRVLEVAEAMFAAFSAGDLDGFRDHLGGEERRKIDEQLNDTEIDPEMIREMFRKGTEGATFSIESVEMDRPESGQALVHFTGSLNDRTVEETLLLVKEKGVWKIVSLEWKEGDEPDPVPDEMDPRQAVLDAARAAFDRYTAGDIEGFISGLMDPAAGQMQSLLRNAEDEEDFRQEAAKTEFEINEVEVDRPEPGSALVHVTVYYDEHSQSENISILMKNSSGQWKVSVLEYEEEVSGEDGYPMGVEHVVTDFFNAMMSADVEGILATITGKALEEFNDARGESDFEEELQQFAGSAWRITDIQPSYIIGGAWLVGFTATIEGQEYNDLLLVEKVDGRWKISDVEYSDEELESENGSDDGAPEPAPNPDDDELGPRPLLNGAHVINTVKDLQQEELEAVNFADSYFYRLYEFDTEWFRSRSVGRAAEFFDRIFQSEEQLAEFRRRAKSFDWIITDIQADMDTQGAYRITAKVQYHNGTSWETAENWLVVQNIDGQWMVIGLGG